MRHLVLLSGGPDSAVCLKKVLTETDDPVVALHVSFNDEFGRWRMERAAVEMISLYCRSMFRDFVLEYASCTFPRQHGYSDIPMLAPFAASIVLGYRDIGKTWLGVDDDQDDKPAGRHFRKALEACVFEERHGIPCPREYFPPLDYCMPKREVRAYLGETLWNLTWSCRQPQGMDPCGRCRSCINRRKAYE